MNWRFHDKIIVTIVTSYNFYWKKYHKFVAVCNCANGNKYFFQYSFVYTTVILL